MVGRSVRSLLVITGVCSATALDGIAQSVAVEAHAERAPKSNSVTVDVERAPLEHVLKTIAQQAGLRLVYDQRVTNHAARITMHVHAMSAGDAFARALTGTGLVASITLQDVVLLDAGMGTTTLAQGGIVGTVVDARTKAPLSGVAVSLDGATKGVVTNDRGEFRFSSVTSGSHSIAVRLIGYMKRVTSVTVPDEQQVSLNIVLEPSVNALDQVVVTGTVVQTELRAVPNAMTVITAKQIEERGITKIDQLFRGDVPGVFAPRMGSDNGVLLDAVTMFSRGGTALDETSAGTSFGTNPIKTYVDGVELANPAYLSQIDPKSVERIEILTGPQASTIYGSNAINGVMQIFTKRGTTSTPQLTVNLLSGFVQNNFSSALTPQHDYSAQVSGIEGKLSYNAGGSWNYMGAWTPAKQTTRTEGFGGVRYDVPTPVGRVTADVTLSRRITQNLQHGATNQPQVAAQRTGWRVMFSSDGVTQPTTYALAGQTLGLTLSYVPAPWWSHELGLGQDGSDYEQRGTAPGYALIWDTTLSLSQTQMDRRSLHYATTIHLPITSFAQATVTAGADAWKNLTSSWSISTQTLTGFLTGSTSVSRQPGHNTGGFVQTQIGLRDRLFLTYGLRAEWNPDYGATAEPNYAPRYGIAYTQELGLMTVKLRGAYGRSTRPPQPRLKVARTVAQDYSPSDVTNYFLPYYGGIFDTQLANPELGPEYQQGGEGGLELYLGTRGSLVVTRYNQTVNGLIVTPAADSVRTVVPCIGACYFYTSRDADGYGYYDQLENLNLGSIRNQGWELQGSVNLGPFTTRETYSWTKSRVLGVDPRYRSFFDPVFYPQFQPGATFRYLPEHTWALGVTYARGSSRVGLNVTGNGRATVDRNDFFYQNLTTDIRLPQNRLNVVNPRGYINFNSGYALADLTASHRFSSRIEGVLQVQNLMDRYTNERNAAYASMGRQLMLGGRVRAN